jgi:hypothetical protein
MKRVTRIALWIIIPLATLFLMAVAAGFALFHQFYPNAPEADFPPAKDAATAQRQDFSYFRNYLELNRSYTPEARARAASLLAKYESESEPLSTAQFDLAIARMAALADNGHSRVHPGPLSRRHTRLPCRLYHFDDGYRVLRARAACIELLGAKVISPGCFWIMYFYPMQVPTLDPDIRDGYSFADYAALRDPVLERVLRAISP